MRLALTRRGAKQLFITPVHSARLASNKGDVKPNEAALTGMEPPTPPDHHTTVTGQAFPGDLRSTSALGLGDNLLDHTSKWMDRDGGPGQNGNLASPMEYVWRAEPIKVHGSVVASYGSDNPALGCPVEYISLKGTSKDKPRVCKYTGNKYYSDDWRGSH